MLFVRVLRSAGVGLVQLVGGVGACGCSPLTFPASTFFFSSPGLATSSLFPSTDRSTLMHAEVQPEGAHIIITSMTSIALGDELYRKRHSR